VTPVALRVALRADASVAIGSGHVMRCLALADALKARGAHCLLLTRALPDRIHEWAVHGGHDVVYLAQGAERPVPGRPYGLDEEEDARACLAALAGCGGADRLVVDHYGLGAAFESAIRPAVGWIGVIDDLADRAHDCEVLLDQNICEAAEERYAQLVPQGCVTLLGPRYALLSGEYARARQSASERDGVVHNVLVFLGGGDVEGITLRVLHALSALDRKDLSVTVVVGGANPHACELALACAARPNTEFVVDTVHMASLVARSHLAVGAPGSATWERCYLGAPAILASFADNHVPVAAGVSAAGAAVDLGMVPDADTIADALRELLADPPRVRAMSAAALRLMRGARPGARCEMAARVMAGSSRGLLRSIGPDDEARVLAWRNSPRVRERSLSDRVLSSEEHHAWFVSALDDAHSLHWVFEFDDVAIGVVSMKEESDGTLAWGFYLGDPSAPPGAGTVMCRLALREAFVVEGVPSVSAEVLADNDVSLRLHRRLGFSQVGSRMQEREAGLARVVLLEVDRDAWAKADREAQGEDQR
jgi:UDP-2,4-diacetamido-2,4,6-trideoxy-beta-L-altropyranose hydrolase